MGQKVLLICGILSPILYGLSDVLAGMQWQGYSFRDQTISELAALGFGAWAGLKAPHIEQGLATPWAGAEERIFWYGYQSWYIVLAVTLLRQRFKAGAEDSGLRGKTNARYRRLTMSPPPAFKTPDGEVAYWAAYDAAMKLWPVPYEETNIASRFGLTHVVVCGPKDAPPLVLLHGYWATLTMWTPNVADFSKGYRVYAVDVMGQPGKSIPDEPVRNAADYVAWLTATLNGLHLDRVSLVGMSYGGWLALTYAVAAPQRVQKLVLLSPAASVLPIVRQFSLRAMLMLFLPTRFTVNSFMRWLGIKDNPGDSETRRVGNNVVDLMYLGLKHFRMPQAIMPTVFSDTNLRALHVPTLLLLGDREVIYDAATALARARRLLPDFQGDLLPASSHDMCFSQHQLVNARILDFLRKSLTDDQDKTTERSMA